MRDIDKKIQEALHAEDKDLFAEYGGEQGMLEMVFDSFRSKQRWWVAIVIVWTIGLMALMVMTTIKFFEVETVREMIMYGLATTFMGGAIAMIKLWYFMELNKNALTREIKRVELQVARLSSRLGK
ncbi:MAG: hypothetical protein IH914_07835 [candidate division Zixibacteria bacterium]|nr:hypothetical protein [candidate division Zixibacteria bacterium]